MACDDQRQALNAAIKQLANMQAELERLPPSTPANVRKQLLMAIGAAQSAVQTARVALDNCLVPPETMSVDVSVQLQYSGPVVGAKTEQDHLTLQMVFSGPEALRSFQLQPFTITHSATTHIVPNAGTFVRATGQMTVTGS